jgi:uncharacterized membrane protein
MSSRPLWRLLFGDEVFGPYDRGELEALLAEGRLDRMSLLAAEGQTGDWRPAGEIAELEDLFEGRALPAKAKPPRVPGGRPGGPDPMMLHLVYGLYAASFLMGVTALAGVIVAYVKRAEAQGSWQASHFIFQIRTFWIALAASVVGFLTMPIGIGFLILLLTAVWMIWRIVRGWVRLSQYRAVEDPEGWL